MTAAKITCKNVYEELVTKNYYELDVQGCFLNMSEPKARKTPKTHNEDDAMSYLIITQSHLFHAGILSALALGTLTLSSENGPPTKQALHSERTYPSRSNQRTS